MHLSLHIPVLALKVAYPTMVHLNRGNHEARDINSRDGFEKEVMTKYGHHGRELFDMFSDVFACLVSGVIDCFLSVRV
jgi:hypothetical protein